MCDSTTTKGKKSLSKKKNSHHMSIWLAVDDENKEVRYRVDPSWLKNATEEEQKSAFSQLTALVDVYHRAGYTIIDFPKKLKK
jgi:hypothetical protein